MGRDLFLLWQNEGVQMPRRARTQVCGGGGGGGGKSSEMMMMMICIIDLKRIVIIANCSSQFGFFLGFDKKIGFPLASN